MILLIYPIETNLVNENTPGKTSELQQFEEKVMNLLSNWKKEQDEVLKTVSSDIMEVKRQNNAIQNSNIEIEK